MTQLFANNAYSVLASAALSTDTTLALASGTGSRFPTPSGGDFFEATLVGYDTNGNENAWEVVKCTGRSGDSLTVTRAVDGSTAVGWVSASRIEMRAAAGLLGRLVGKAASGANSDITALGSLASINGGPLAGMRNRIMNGNFAINQRGVSGTVTLGAGAYGHDCWKAGASGCTYTFAASGNDVVITISAGSLIQIVEDKNVEGGVYALSHAGTAQARIAINGAATSDSYATASLATPLLSGNASGLQQVAIEFSTGTVAKVQLEPGSVASAFERRPYSQELILCKRHYQPWSFGMSGLPSGNLTITANFNPAMMATPTMVRTGASVTGSESGTVVTPINNLIFFGQNTAATAVGGSGYATSSL